MKIDISIRHDSVIAGEVFYAMSSRWPEAKVSVWPESERFCVKVDDVEVEQGHSVRVDAHRQVVEALSRI